MGSIRFIEKINGLKCFTDRFDLLHVSKGGILSNSDAESLCLADYKVFMCGQNYGPMTREYVPFHDSIKLSKEDILFLEESRFNTIDEPLIAGFYYDALSNAQGEKTSKYVDKIIDNYLKVIGNPKEYKDTDLCWVLKSLIYNSKTYKHRERDVLVGIDTILSSDYTLDLKFRLIVNTYSFAFIKAKQVEVLTAKHHLMDSISESYNDNCNFFNLLLKCIPRNKERIIREIYYRLAENEDIIIKQHPIDSTLSENLLNKSIYLENGGFYDEAEDCYRQFLIAKTEGKGVESYNQSWTIPQQIFHPYIIAIQNSAFPLMTLALDDSLLPPEIDEPALLSELKRLGIRTTFVDNNGNPHPGDGFYSSKIMSLQYHNQYELITLHPILASIKGLIENGCFSGTKLCEYISSTWLGKGRLTVNRSLRETHESWLDIMRPSICSICFEITSEIMSEGTYKGDYLCSIDSLVTKIEGCLRDACRHLLINTVKEKSHDEIPLEQLFDKIEKYQVRKEKVVISSASLRMLRGILTKQGKNLRNDIAHGFTSIADYSINNAITVLHCLLKVSAMDIPEGLTGDDARVVEIDKLK